jgi:predicted metal-dependent hydrolase
LKRRATEENRSFERGLAHFNAREFFEAHEAWEELWLREPLPDKAFLQGLIQIAAAFHHYGRGNLRGTKSLLAAGSSKLEDFPGEHRGIAVHALRALAQEWLEILEDTRHLRPENVPQIDLAPQGKAPRKPSSRKRSKKKRRMRSSTA